MISIRNDRIVLRSKRLNQEIIPRLSTAHNFSLNPLPVYQFLCDLQTQYVDQSGLGFHWGPISTTFKFLPRATYKNVILERAKWQFQKSDFQFLFEDKSEGDHSAIATWRRQWKIPRLVILADADNELLIDMENEMSLQVLKNSIRKRDKITLEEFLYEPDKLVVKDSHGEQYTNECIAILLKEKETRSQTSLRPRETENTFKAPRYFDTGSEWLYYKFYCGIKTGDRLLTDILLPLTIELQQKELIDYFFFIRYADPDLHLRFRLHLKDVEKIGQVIKLVYQHTNEYLIQGLITKTQTDTYKRELERYGSSSMETSEKIFFVDSRSTMELLNMIEGEEGEEIRWLYAVRSIDELLNNFNYPLSEKQGLMDTLKTAFVKEHGASKELKLQLDAKFRKVRPQLEKFMDTTIDQQREEQELAALLEWKRKELQPHAGEILRLRQSGNLEIPLNDLMASYIHMMLNRIFRARQRTHEMVCYDLLHKFYKSVHARLSKKPTIESISP